MELLNYYLNKEYFVYEILEKCQEMEKDNIVWILPEKISIKKYLDGVKIPKDIKVDDKNNTITLSNGNTIKVYSSEKNNNYLQNNSFVINILEYTEEIMKKEKYGNPILRAEGKEELKKAKTKEEEKRARDKINEGMSRLYLKDVPNCDCWFVGKRYKWLNEKIKDLGVYFEYTFCFYKI